MDTIELLGPLPAPSADPRGREPRGVATSPYADSRAAELRPVATAGRDSFVLLEYCPIGPFMLVVALAVLVFAPLFALAALVALTGAIFAAPFLLIRHFSGRW